MFLSIPSTLRIWHHQRAALKFLVDHLNSTTEPCLIRMPTGTGKTGVMACLSLLSAPGQTLIVTPWTNLRDQAIEALKNNFWQSIGVSPPSNKIIPILPSTVLTADEEKSKVFVSTFAGLTQLQRSNSTGYAKLASLIDTVIVDECHYEPAIEWGKAVKKLNAKIVLLTATPYRNDLKLFRIQDPRTAVFQYTHQNAEADEIIRKLKFDRLNDTLDIKALSISFSRYWMTAKRSNQLPVSSPRAIICCASAADIRAAVSALRREGVDAIGIHEQFSGSPTHLLKDVPKPAANHAEVWVHQHKLTEGLDDFKFCCVALFCELRSDRKLIQQIGRILRRHNTDRKNAPAILLAPDRFKIQERWLAYRDFEIDSSLLSSDHYRHVVNTLLTSQPTIEYFDGRFRKRFDPLSLSINPQVVIAPSVLIRQTTADFTLNEYIEDCTDAINLTDAVILGPSNAPCKTSADFALWVYASVRNSRLLQDTSLYEIRLEAHCVAKVGRYLFISDTTGTFPKTLLDNRTNGVGADRLARALDSTYRITNIATSSAVPFDTVLRASDQRGHDISNIAASLTDRIQICRSARGASSNGRRYVGIDRGRIRQELTDAHFRKHSPDEFQRWASTIAAEIDSSTDRHPVFGRYMQTRRPSSPPTPVSISVDFSEDKVTLQLEDGTVVHALQSSVPISSSIDSSGARSHLCQFSFGTGDTPKATVELAIDYQDQKCRFWFRSVGSRAVHVEDPTAAQNGRKSLADYFNQNQDLILIGIEGGELVYQGESFYAVDYEHAEKSLLEYIETTATPAVTTEKGTKEQLEAAKVPGKKATKFIDGSLFKAIAERNVALPFTPEVLVCDDLGTESCDFLAANFTDRQIALVHAKVGSGAAVSASSFHEVAAQAMKNLVYLARNTERPDGAKKWTRASFWNTTNVPRLYLAPKNGVMGIALWIKIRSEIIDRPDGQLFVVLATSGCCDHTELKAVAHDPKKRTAEVAQLFHLLDCLVGYSRQLGVRLKVYDVPFQPAPPPPRATKKPAKVKP